MKPILTTLVFAASALAVAAGAQAQSTGHNHGAPAAAQSSASTDYMTAMDKMHGPMMDAAKSRIPTKPSFAE